MASSPAGSFSGHWSRNREFAPGDFRGAMPRFSEDNVERNLELVDGLREIADERGCSVAQLAIAWVLTQGEDIVPLVGARRRDRLEEALGALDVDLEDEALAAIERAIPKGAAAGERYDARQMAILDSERS